MTIYNFNLSYWRQRIYDCLTKIRHTNLCAQLLKGLPMKNHHLPTLVALTALTLPLLFHPAQAADAPAKAYFTNLKNGETVSSPIKITFGISGMNVMPAGTDAPNTGHFHLLVDTQLSDEEKKFAITKDDRHQHFGKGQTETTLTLPSGKHTLQLVMGDGNHMLHTPPVMSDVINIIVK
jgi:hypothetical protein